MRTAIIGDSFAKNFSNTWLETVSRNLGLDVVLHKGWEGGAEYYIYETFVDYLRTGQELDLVIFCHTEQGRLVNNDHYGINWVTASSDDKLPDAVRSAARNYYIYLYNERFHKDIHDLFLEKIQRMCVDRGIKQVHIPSFDYPVSGDTGLWVVNGLHSLAMTQGTHYFEDATLRNHFSRQLHDHFADWLTTHIRYYIKHDLDYHVVMLNPDEFDV